MSIAHWHCLHCLDRKEGVQCDDSSAWRDFSRDNVLCVCNMQSKRAEAAEMIRVGMITLLGGQEEAPLQLQEESLLLTLTFK